MSIFDATAVVVVNFFVVVDNVAVVVGFVNVVGVVLLVVTGHIIFSFGVVTIYITEKTIAKDNTTQVVLFTILS